MQLWEVFCLNTNTCTLACVTCGKMLMGTGLKVYIENNGHVVHAIWMESSIWDGDHAMEVEQLDLFKKNVSSHHPLDTEKMDKGAPTQGVNK